MREREYRKTDSHVEKGRERERVKEDKQMDTK